MTIEFYVMTLVALVAAGAAFAFYLQYSAVRKAEDERRQAADEAQAKAKKAQTELESAKEELTRRRTESADLREKLNDLRQRTFKKEADRKAKAGKDDLSEQLYEAQRHLDEEHARYDVLRREADGMHEDILKLRESNRKIEDALKAAQAAAARAAAAPAGTAPVAAAPVAPVAAPQKTDSELKARAEMLEGQLREARRHMTDTENELKNARGRLSTANRQGLVTRSELDLFREKLVWSEKRVVELEKLLFDNKIALPAREAAPQQKPPQPAPAMLARESANTGGEGVVAGAADYVPEQAEQAAVTEAPSATTLPAETTAEAPGAAGEAGPSAVAPVRRPRAAVDARKDDAPKAE